MITKLGMTQTKTQTLNHFFELISESQMGRQIQVEKRNSRRIEYPYPIYLSPLDVTGVPILEESYCVLGRHISERGFDFYHKEPIADKYVIASFEFSPNRWLGVKAELNWCRFGRHGYFENGGTFSHVVDSPFGVGQIDL